MSLTLRVPFPLPPRPPQQVQTKTDRFAILTLTLQLIVAQLHSTVDAVVASYRSAPKPEVDESRLF